MFIFERNKSMNYQLQDAFFSLYFNIPVDYFQDIHLEFYVQHRELLQQWLLNKFSSFQVFPKHHNCNL